MGTGYGADLVCAVCDHSMAIEHVRYAPKA